MRKMQHFAVRLSDNLLPGAPTTGAGSWTRPSQLQCRRHLVSTPDGLMLLPAHTVVSSRATASGLLKCTGAGNTVYCYMVQA